MVLIDLFLLFTKQMPNIAQLCTWSKCRTTSVSVLLLTDISATMSAVDVDGTSVCGTLTEVRGNGDFHTLSITWYLCCIKPKLIGIWHPFFKKHVDTNVKYAHHLASKNFVKGIVILQSMRPYMELLDRFQKHRRLAGVWSHVPNKSDESVTYCFINTQHCPLLSLNNQELKR